jgi:hypothetical protein
MERYVYEIKTNVEGLRNEKKKKTELTCNLE